MWFFMTRRLFGTGAVAGKTKVKPDVKLVQKIRRDFEGVSMKRAMEALQVTSNDYNQAIRWITDQMQSDGERRALKVENRKASEGLIVLGSSPRKTVMFEVNRSCV
jgi:translation elongation factor EF-Ts